MTTEWVLHKTQKGRIGSEERTKCVQDGGKDKQLQDTEWQTPNRTCNSNNKTDRK